MYRLLKTIGTSSNGHPGEVGYALTAQGSTITTAVKWFDASVYPAEAQAELLPTYKKLRTVKRYEYEFERMKRKRNGTNVKD